MTEPTELDRGFLNLNYARTHCALSPAVSRTKDGWKSLPESLTLEITPTLPWFMDKLPKNTICQKLTHKSELFSFLLTFCVRTYFHIVICLISLCGTNLWCPINSFITMSVYHFILILVDNVIYKKKKTKAHFVQFVGKKNLTCHYRVWYLILIYHFFMLFTLINIIMASAYFPESTWSGSTLEVFNKANLAAILHKYLFTIKQINH